MSVYELYADLNASCAETKNLAIVTLFMRLVTHAVSTWWDTRQRLTPIGQTDALRLICIIAAIRMIGILSH